KAGETAVFSVTAEGSHLSYVWYHDEKVIRDENENVLMIENAQAEDEGTYQVYVFNSLGGVMSSPAELTLKGSGPVSEIWLRNPEYVEDESGSAYFLFDVEGVAVFSVEGSFNAVDWTDVSYTVEGGKVKIPASYNYVLYRAWAEASYDEEAPKIVVQPQNTKVKEGEPFTLSVTATGSAPLSYQWIFEGLKIEDATNSVYEVEAAKASDAGRYIVTVTNPYGSVTSSIATVRVTGITPVVEPPVITRQPTDVTVDEESSFALSVTASGTEPLAYQWFKDGTVIEGATTSVYEVTTAQTSDSGSYTVTVSNTAGKAESSTALVTVNKVVPPTPIDNLELIYREVREIDGVYYLVFDVEGSSVYFIDGSHDGINWVPVEYETLSDGGVIFPITEDFILYRARADNVVPPVVEPPVITRQPADVTIDEGNSFTLSVTATGAEPLVYQWFKYGTAIEGATAPVYEVTTAQTGNSGVYTVRVSNIAGSVTSSGAVVKVESVIPVVEPPVITGQPQDVTVDEGSTILLMVTVTGSEPLYYQWFKDGNPISGLSARIRITYINGHSGLSILHAKKSDSGHYTVTVSNEAGTVTSRTAVVTVNGGIVYSDLVYREVRKIDGVKYLVFDVSGSSDYQIESSEDGTAWKQVECEHLDDGGIIVPMTERFMLYRAVTDNTTPTTIKIVTQPVGGTFKVGETIRLSVTVEGSASYYYQWYKDGNILWDATSSELVISDAKESDSGSYVVKVAGMESVWNPVIDSDPAVVTVVAEPQGDIWLQNGNVRVDGEEEYITFDVVNAEITKVEMTANGTNWESIEYNISSQNVLSFKYDFDNPLYMVTGVVDGATKRIIQFRVENGRIGDLNEF
ncbi:MAG: immunoglobulin domain-containing protein, partial [Verrucomicrobia bacterium]|nr:immunoglobulin domain-containing protein [Verrucomicrobiota bacterium]